MPQKKSINELAQVIADHQASLSRLGEAWGQIVADALDDTDRKLIARLESLVADVQANYRRNTAKAVNQLEYIRTKIEEIRVRAFVKAEKELRKAAPELIENENNWTKKLLSELTGEAKAKFSDITDGQAEKLLKNSIQINKTWDQWWTNTAYGDTLRIADVINAGVVQGLTIPQMTRLIMGTKEGNYADGVLSTSRRHARNMARTLCAGISNQAKDQFYRDNADIVPQVEWLDTLDGRTCASCGGLSRQRFSTTEPHPVPPLHPSCRCVLIPVTELTDLGEDMPRPAANADFDAEAKRMYEEKYPQKRFEDLAASTREQYRHKAVHAYEERTGKPAYNRAPGSMRFSDYLQQSTEQFKKDWLGPGRYALYKTGKYPIETFVPPYPNKAFTVKQVKEMDIESFRRSLAEVKADDAPAVSKPEFVPAKTIEEAENYIAQFVDNKSFGALGVSYAGVNIDVANTINKQLGILLQEFDVGKFGGIIAPAKNTKLGKLISEAFAAYSPVRNSFMLRRDAMKSLKIAQDAFAKEANAIKGLLEHPERYDFSKLSAQTRRIIERSRKSGRATIPQTIEEAISHEFGHMLERHVKKHPLWNGVSERMKQYADNISGYAGENINEYIAESFVSYHKGENLIDPELKTIFESLKKR